MSKIKWPVRFSKKDIGSQVFYIENGWGIIKSAGCKDTTYSIVVDFEDADTEEFTPEGLYDIHAATPTLFREEDVPKFILKRCPKPEKKTTVKVIFKRWVVFDQKGASTIRISKASAEDYQEQLKNEGIQSVIHYIEKEFTEEF